ncbi:MAG TPA: hypothetical protein PLP17_10185, partial [Oligoflexia bacterium]|nr:hypothetical protein [Oligoflexia bacterium]
ASMRQDADDLVCENMPHLPVCLISGERLSETVFCAGAAQELFRQRLASWKCCPEEDAARASVPALSAHEYCSGAARLAERAAEMRGILAPLPGYIAERPHFFENKQRLAQASKHFLSALEGRFFHRQHDPAFLRQRFLRDGYGALLEAQVAVDKIWRPETDPVDGWVDLAAVPRADGGEETVVDNPFQRLYFAHSLGGALVEYDYKPRKLNLLNCEARTANSVPAFCGKLLTREAGGGFTQLGGEFSFSSVRLIRKSPDLLKVRFVEKLEAGASGARREWTGSLYKDFTVRAGLGAHQANATTGFSLEYWLESDVPAAADMFVGVEWTMMLPSGDPRVMSARPLLCVGGESERVLALTQSWLLDSAFHPGGLYGVRLIDGLEGLVIDLRASHRLDFIELAPLWSEGRSAVDSELEQSMCFGGTRVRFIAPLSAFAGDYRSNTIFVSIY